MYVYFPLLMFKDIYALKYLLLRPNNFDTTSTAKNTVLPQTPEPIDTDGRR